MSCFLEGFGTRRRCPVHQTSGGGASRAPGPSKLAESRHLVDSLSLSLSVRVSVSVSVRSMNALEWMDGQLKVRRMRVQKNDVLFSCLETSLRSSLSNFATEVYTKLRSFFETIVVNDGGHRKPSLSDTRWRTRALMPLPRMPS